MKYVRIAKMQYIVVVAVVVVVAVTYLGYNPKQHSLEAEATRTANESTSPLSALHHNNIKSCDSPLLCSSFGFIAIQNHYIFSH